MDPSDLVSGPNREKKLPTVTSIFEIEKLLEAPDVGTDFGIRDRSILEVIYAAGLRVSEAVSIDIDKFDLEKKELQVIGKGSKPSLSRFFRWATTTAAFSPASVRETRSTSFVRTTVLPR